MAGVELGCQWLVGRCLDSLTTVYAKFFLNTLMKYLEPGRSSCLLFGDFGQLPSHGSTFVYITFQIYFIRFKSFCVPVFCARLTFVACSHVHHMSDIIFSPDFDFDCLSITQLTMLDYRNAEQKTLGYNYQIKIIKQQISSLYSSCFSLPSATAQ